MLTRQRLFIQFFCVLLLLGVFSLGNKIQAAENYPLKPIIIIVPGEAGAGVDIMFRKINQKASMNLGQPIMILNKPGASGSIALRELHDAKPDGYTLGAVTPVIVANKLQGILPYDHDDFTLIGSYYFSFPWIIASTKTKRPFKTMEEVLSFAKSNPGEVKLATDGVGYLWWIVTMAFQQKIGFKFNIIPQPGTAAMVTSQVAGGHADIGITSMAPARPMIDSGLIKLLAFFGPQRAQIFKNVPSVKELGYDVGIGAFGVIVGPRKLPNEILQKLDKAFEVAVNDPEYQKFANENNYTPLYLPPDKVVHYLDEQRKVFRSVMGEAGILKEK